MSISTALIPSVQQESGHTHHFAENTFMNENSINEMLFCFRVFFQYILSYSYSQAFHNRSPQGKAGIKSH